MREYKEQCEALVKAGATILVRDGFTKNGLPVYVTRKVTGCYGIKRGRDSEWGVMMDRPFEDGADGVSYRLILGTNIDGKVDLGGLYNDMKICIRQLSDEERTMILSDAETRLKMAYGQVRSSKNEEFFREACNGCPTSFLKRNDEFQDSLETVRNMTVRFERDGKHLFSVDNSVSSKQPGSTTPDSVHGRNRIIPVNNGQIAIQIPSMSKSFSIQIQFGQEDPEPEPRLMLDWI